MLAQDRYEALAQLAVMDDARRVGGEAFIVQQRLESRRLAEAAELIVVAHCEEELAVGGAERVVRARSSRGDCRRAATWSPS